MQQNIIGAVDEVTTTMPPALLVSATYDSQKKFFCGRIILATNHTVIQN